MRRPFRAVEAHNRAHYAAFSTLIRSTFDAAAERFGPESIDLLHIDGHHTEEAVRHDLEIWLPKLRPGGILLLHDVTMRGRDFGVWKVWAELEERGRTATFEESPGLGVWEKTPAGSLPPLLEKLFACSAAAYNSRLTNQRHCAIITGSDTPICRRRLPGNGATGRFVLPRSLKKRLFRFSGRVTRVIRRRNLLMRVLDKVTGKT